MQSFLFSRATVCDGAIAKNLTSLKVGSVLLRDVFSNPPCALVELCSQPLTESNVEIPYFAKDFCPPIHPFEDQHWPSPGVPLLCLHSLKVNPCPDPPMFGTETVITCQPIMFHLQEESCLRISSFLADGVMGVSHGDVISQHSLNSLKINLTELDVIIPLNIADLMTSPTGDSCLQFNGARLHIEDLHFSESPSLKVKQLNLEKDPACFLLWQGQPCDGSQKKWAISASNVILSLEISSASSNSLNPKEDSFNSWRCLEFKQASIQIAMVSADGSSLTVVPPPGGVVRVGISCNKILSNTSVEQLFFVLELYAYFGKVWDKVSVKSGNLPPAGNLSLSLADRVPCDTAVSLALTSLNLRFLESSSHDIKGLPLAEFCGEDLLLRVCHRMLGGAVVISSKLRWRSVSVSCVEVDNIVDHQNDHIINSVVNGSHPLRLVFWVHNGCENKAKDEQFDPFLDINLEHMIPLSKVDKGCHSLSVSACIVGLRLSGGMNYAESLFHRFGIFGPGGGPGEGLSKGMKNLSQGPLSKLFKTSHLIVKDVEEDVTSGLKDEIGYMNLEIPNDVDVRIEFKDWLFALEGVQEIKENKNLRNTKRSVKEGSFWHATFRRFQVNAVSEAKKKLNVESNSLAATKSPFEKVTVLVEGLQVLKPLEQKLTYSEENRAERYVSTPGGINVDATLALTENCDEMEKWTMENIKLSVKQPIEAIVTKDELEHLTCLCKSEVDATGRIIAGILKLLKLEKTVGQSTLIQLSNLGSESFDKILLPEKLGNINYSKNNCSSPSKMDSTFASIEDAISASQMKCESLISEFFISESSRQQIDDIRSISENLESIRHLLKHIRQQ